MAPQTLLQIFLTLHITAFTLMGGTIAADSSIYSRVRKYLSLDKNKALIMLDSSAKFHLLIQAGAILLIATGIGMVITLHGVVAQMLWFKIKMIFVLFIVLNGTFVAKPGILKLKKALADNNDSKVMVLQNRLSVFYIIQLIAFLVIFTLSVFKF